ncbi:MAG: hypothetical protein BWK74_04790 [Desulfobacteraceae bacterium A6]|nr:MAG: hypothetical protein BWK74_04790 [Desulfobacteraceae bacterium A6]
MIPEIKRILYTTDLSENAKYAFTYAATIANRFDAKITILHVLEVFSQNAERQIAEFLGKDRWNEIQKNKKQEYIESIKKRLNDFCEEMYSSLKSCPFLVDEIIVKEGIPVDEILKAVDSENFDMVVMGTHGHGVIADALIGSNARRVLRRCKKPVMVIRLPR